MGINKEIDKKYLIELRSKSKMLVPIVRIGKKGINENMIKDINHHLKKRRLIKIKILKNSLKNADVDTYINQIVEKCNCILVDKIGLTFSIYK